MTNLPPATERALEAVSKRPVITVFIALPNMLFLNFGLVREMLNWAINRDYRLIIHMPAENRFQDYARNECVEEFLKSSAEWILFIDSDVQPNPQLLELTRKGKDIIAGCVFAYIKANLMPSIWISAPCEECVNRKIWSEEKRIHDARIYKVDETFLFVDNPDLMTGRDLFHWNPINSEWECAVALDCRCKGTGKDPWVFRVHPQVFSTDQPFQCDSVGAAALAIHRRVFEKLKKPYFRFLYTPQREIMLTEDHYFCWRAKEAGFEIWADPQMACTHYKAVDLLAINNLMVKAYNVGREEGGKEALKSRKIEIPEILPKFLS